MVYKPPRSSSSSTPYGAPKLDVDPQLAALLGSATAHQRQVSPSSMASTPHLQQQQQLLVAGADGKYRIASSPVVTGRSSRSAASSQKPKPSQQQMVSAGGGVGGGGRLSPVPSQHEPSLPASVRSRSSAHTEMQSQQGGGAPFEEPLPPRWGMLENKDDVRQGAVTAGHTLQTMDVQARARRAPRLRNKPMQENEYKHALTYLIPDSPKAPSFRPSEPVRSFAFATAHPDGHDTLSPKRAAGIASGGESSDGGGGGGGPLDVATAVEKARAKVEANGHTQGYSHLCRSVLDTTTEAPYTPNARARALAGGSGSNPNSPPIGEVPPQWRGSPDMAPSFIRGHPAAQEVETLWGFTGQLRAGGVAVAGSWPPRTEEEEEAEREAAEAEAKKKAVPRLERRPSYALAAAPSHVEKMLLSGAPSGLAPLSTPGSRRSAAAAASARKRKRLDELQYAVAGAIGVLGEEGVTNIRRQLRFALGLPVVLTPLTWYSVSDGTMKMEELAMITLACMCAAFAAHDGLLQLCLWLATCGHGEEFKRAADAAAARAGVEDDSEAEEEEVVAPAPAPQEPPDVGPLGVDKAAFVKQAGGP